MCQGQSLLVVYFIYSFSTIMFDRCSIVQLILCYNIFTTEKKSLMESRVFGRRHPSRCVQDVTFHCKPNWTFLKNPILGLYAE